MANQCTHITADAYSRTAAPVVKPLRVQKNSDDPGWFRLQVDGNEPVDISVGELREVAQWVLDQPVPPES